MTDGDTLTVLVDRKPIKVRLADIDAPERKQPYGTRSRQSLAELCHKKLATVGARDTDRYGRTVGYVRCAGVEANAEQVRRGMAWVFTRYARPDSPLHALEAPAPGEAAALGRFGSRRLRSRGGLLRHDRDFSLCSRFGRPEPPFDLRPLYISVRVAARRAPHVRRALPRSG